MIVALPKCKSQARGLPRGSLSVRVFPVFRFMISPCRASKRVLVFRFMHWTTNHPYPHLPTSIPYCVYRYNVTVPMPGKDGCSQDVQPKRFTAHYRNHSFRSGGPLDSSGRCSVRFLYSLFYPCPIVLINIRFYVRRWIVRRVNLSDYLMATALVS